MKPFDQYPAALASLNLDLAIAPLADNDFNRCKSHLKILEYGVLGLPVIASSPGPYDQCPVKLVQGNGSDDWINSIRYFVDDPDRCQQQGRALQDWVRNHHLLTNRVPDWCHALGVSEHVG